MRFSYEFPGLYSSPGIVGQNRLPGHVNYYLGESTKWHLGVAQYARVRYKSLYRGIDLAFHGTPHNLEHDFILSPGAEVSTISMRFEGAADVHLNPSGDLVVNTKVGPIIFRKPSIYQEFSNGKHVVDGAFNIDTARVVSFSVGSYDKTRELIIDPVLSYSTYFNGTIFSIAMDSTGDIYMAGQAGVGLPLKAAYQSSPGSSEAAFITKFSPASNNLIYSTYFGGSGNNGAIAMALDAAGNAYITGNSASPDIPTTNGAFMTQYPGICNTPFVAKFDPTGAVLNLYWGKQCGRAWPRGRQCGRCLYHRHNCFQRPANRERLSVDFFRTGEHFHPQRLRSETGFHRLPALLFDLSGWR